MYMHMCTFVSAPPCCLPPIEIVSSCKYSTICSEHRFFFFIFIHYCFVQVLKIEGSKLNTTGSDKVLQIASTVFAFFFGFHASDCPVTW